MNKAHHQSRFAVFFSCLFLILSIAGSVKIQAQESVPNSSEKTTSGNNFKNDQTDGKQSTRKKTESLQDRRADQLQPEKNNDSAEAEMESKKTTRDSVVNSKTVSTETMTYRLKEDVAEYQKIESEENASGLKSVDDSTGTVTVRVDTKSFQVITNAVREQSNCEWSDFRGTRDPFSAQHKACWNIYKQDNTNGYSRDPFAKPVMIPAQNNFTTPTNSFADFPTTTATVFIRRSQNGFDPKWIDWILEHSSREGIDPLLVLEVMRWESSFNPNALSPAKAGGLMQFIPATASRFGINPFIPEQAIYGGARYLGFLLRRFNGNVLSALAGYNAGEGAVDAYLHCKTIRAGNKTINPAGRCTANGIPPYAETQKYAAGIWANYQMSVRRATGILDPRERIAQNVRFKFAAAASE